jgi:hypothetical protein
MSHLTCILGYGSSLARDARRSRTSVNRLSVNQRLMSALGRKLPLTSGCRGTAAVASIDPGSCQSAYGAIAAVAVFSRKNTGSSPRRGRHRQAGNGRPPPYSTIWSKASPLFVPHFCLGFSGMVWHTLHDGCDSGCAEASPVRKPIDDFCAGSRQAALGLQGCEADVHHAMPRMTAPTHPRAPLKRDLRSRARNCQSSTKMGTISSRLTSSMQLTTPPGLGGG